MEGERYEKNSAADNAPAASELQGMAQQKESLLVATAKARKDKPEATEAEKRLQEEEEMMRAITQKAALKSVKELAKVQLLWPALHLNQQYNRLAPGVQFEKPTGVLRCLHRC